MSRPKPDEIDKIMIKAMWDNAFRTFPTMVKRQRAALLAAGYSIQLDESALLQKGRDAGVVLK